MKFLPIDRMRERINLDKHDSNYAYFNSLLFLGEMILKIICLSIISGIKGDREKSRYRLHYDLVRADGIGKWREVLDEVLIGPTSQYLDETFYKLQNPLIKRFEKDTWQYESALKMRNCLNTLVKTDEKVDSKVQLRSLFFDFVEIRNKTRGHGAIPARTVTKLIPLINESLNLISENFILFEKQWVYLHKNFSGKYRVSPITEVIDSFNYLKHTNDVRLQNGIYFYVNGPVRLSLMYSDPDLSDFYFANGNFTKNRFETISYISGSVEHRPSEKYLEPVTALPESETHGLGMLDITGKSFSNLPSTPKDYVPRLNLENQLNDILKNDRHPIVTLVGRGGIGKTWLTLKVLHDLSEEDIYEAIVWLSARDIDLIQGGAKIVKPRVVTLEDIAKDYTTLMDPDEVRSGQVTRIEYLANSLRLSPLGPIIFVIDNFETVDSPIDVYNWIDNQIRLPNKIIITTRYREFKGDYPIEVLGMTLSQSKELIVKTSKKLGIFNILDNAFIEELVSDSDGHPYVIKVHLGEMAKVGKKMKLERVIAKQDKVLDALFERTYSRLSPVAQRIFLTLSSWHSSVPQLALEAVLLRPSNEKMDVEGGIEELYKCSLIEIERSDIDDMYFISVPLAAEVFGKRKFSVSAMKTAIEVDCQILQYFGPALKSDIKHGFEPRLKRLFTYLSARIEKNIDSLNEYLPMLEMIGRNYPITWLYLADLYEECEDRDCVEKAKTFTRQYLETNPPEAMQVQAWRKLAGLSRKAQDYVGEIHALVEICQLPGASLESVSFAANIINLLFKQGHLRFDSEEKRIIVGRLIALFEQHLGEADADDYSRLSWLYLHLNNPADALKCAVNGLEEDPENEHCQKLYRKLYKK